MVVLAAGTGRARSKFGVKASLRLTSPQLSGPATGDPLELAQGAWLARGMLGRAGGQVPGRGAPWLAAGGGAEGRGPRTRKSDPRS